MRHKHGKHPSGQYRKSTHHCIWFFCLCVYFLPQVDGFFMSDSKAVLQGCDDNWSFQGQWRIPVLFLTTVCVDVRVLSPGEWTAFSYISAPAPRYELALQGDGNSLYAWLLGVRHQFPVQLTPRRWYRLCLRWDAPRKSFSLTIGGNPDVYQRTAIARAIPPSGRLLLGCQPKDASPGVGTATVELYLFRIWDDVGEHQACEDGSVVGWDSRLWTVTRNQARVQDYALQCGIEHLRKKRDAQGYTTENTHTGVSGGREFLLTSPSPLFSTLASIITNTHKTLQAPVTPSITSVNTATPPPQGHILSTTSALPSKTTLNTTNSSAVTNPITTPTAPSVNLTRPTQATHTTTSGPSQALIGSAVNTTTNLSHTGGFNITSPTTASPASNITAQATHNTSVSAQTLSSSHVSLPITGNLSSVTPTSETPANRTAAHLTASPTVIAQVANQLAVLRTTRADALLTGSFVAQCNFSQYCANDSSYYWMPVEVYGSDLTESDIQIWFSGLFKTCSGSTNTRLCQAFMNAEVRCQDKENIQRTNCTALLQLNQSVNTCDLRRLVDNGTTDQSVSLIKIQILGDVEKVGKGVCVESDITPPGGGFVHCTSTMSYYDVCQIQGPVSVTCESGQTFAFLLNERCDISSTSFTAPPVPTSTSTRSRTMSTDITSPTVTADLSLSNHTSIVDTQHNTSVTPLNTASISNISFMSINSTDNQTNTLSLNTTGSPLVPSVTLPTTTPMRRNTPGTLENIIPPNVTVPLVNTVTLLNTTATTSNATEQLLHTTGTSLNTTITLLHTTVTTHNATETTVAPLNATGTLLETTVTPHNATETTVAPLNATQTLLETTVTPHNAIVTPHNATVTPHTATETLLETTDTPIKATVTPLSVTVSPLNVTETLLETTATSLSTIVTPLSTTVTPLNTTVTPLNTTVTPLNTTVTPLNTTVTPLNTTVTPLSTTITPLNTTVAPLSTTITPLNTTVAPLSTTITPLNTTVAPLNTAVTPLNTTVTPLNTSVAPLNTTVAPLSTTITPLNTTVAPLNTAVTPLNTAVTPLNTTVAPLSTTITPLNTTVTSLNTTVTLLNTTIISLNTAVTPLNTTVVPLITTVTPLNTTVTPLNTTVAPLNTAVTPLNTTIAPLNTTVAPLSTTITPLNTTVAPLSTTITPLNTTVAPLSTTITPLNTTVTPLNTTVLSLNTTLTPLNTTVAPLNTTVTPLNTTVAPLNTTVTPLNTTVAPLNTTVTPLNTTVAPLNTTVTPLNTTVTPFNTTVAPLNTTVTPLNTTVAPLNTTVTPLNTTVAPLNTTVAPLNTAVTPLNSAVTQLNTTVAPLNTTVATLSITITPLNMTVTLLNTTIIPPNTAVTPLNTTVTPLNTTVTLLNTTVSPLNTTVTPLNTTVAPLNTTVTPLNTTVAPLNTTVTPLNTTVAPLNTTVTPLSTTVAPLNTTVAPLNTTVTPLNTTITPLNGAQTTTPITLFNTTESGNATLHNREYNTATSLPKATTTDTMSTTNNTTQSSTTSPFNIGESTTTEPLHTTDTTEFSTTTIPYSTIFETTGAEMSTTEFTTTEPQFSTTTYMPDFTNFNTTSVILDISESSTTTTVLNTTQPSTTHLMNTTQMTPNVTSYNGTVVNRTESSTTQFKNTTEIHTTTFPTTENTTSASTDYKSEPVTTVSHTNATQLNSTTEKTTINTSTTVNSTVYNTTADSVTNNNRNHTTAEPEIQASSPHSNTSTSAPAVHHTTQTTSRENTTANSTNPVDPAVSATVTTATTLGNLTTKSPGALANDLLNQTKDVSSLNSTGVNNLVNQLENLLSAPNISLDVGRTMLSVINNLLNGTTDSLTASSNRLIKAVDSLGLKLVIQDQTENIAFGSLALTVTKVDGTNFKTTSYSLADPLNPQVTKGFHREGRAVESSSPLGKITLPASLTGKLSPEQQKMASRVQFTFFQKSTFFQDTKHVLNSPILGSSVANLSIKNLQDNITFTLKNKQPVAGNYVASCVFWDFDTNGGSGGWNSDGCVVMNSSTENETVCSCNHLTSFAVLLDIGRHVMSDRLQATILTFITYIGCGISAIFIAVTLLTYLGFEKLRRDIPSKILIHLCFGLLLLNLVFLVDSWLALYPNAAGLCISTGFFLHYFLLVSFTWMGLEALHMYLAVVRVFNNYMTRYMLKFSLAGWGVPLVVVIIVIAINKDNYGLVHYGKYLDGTTDDFCWLKNDIAFYVAVVAYFCVIFVWNLAMFVVVMVHLVRIKRQNPQNNQYRSRLQELRSIAGLTFLLGLTWGFAFFAWGPVNLAFMYLFAIFNSLQGFFIFVFHCALKENVRKQWRMYLCCCRLRLAENSDWSRTVTQNHHTKKTSINTVVSSDSDSHSGPRSSVSSDESVPYNGIGSPVDDRLIMSDETNGDVIHNELNSRLRSRFRPT